MSSDLLSTHRPGRSRDLLAVSGKGGEDLVGRLHPDVGPRVLVPGGDPVADVGFERPDAQVRATTYLLVGQLAEPALDHVQPRSRCRREMQVKARVADQEALDL